MSAVHDCSVKISGENDITGGQNILVLLSKCPCFNSNDISVVSLRSISIYPEILKAEMSFHQIGMVLNARIFMMPLIGRNKIFNMISIWRGINCSFFQPKNEFAWKTD